MSSHPPPDLALDVSRLMDSVREEIMQLMQEGVQKTASYCASICAERVVAARREMQRRWAEERRELERVYGLAPGSGFGTPSSARLNSAPRMVSRPSSRPGSCHSWSTPCQELPSSSPQNEGAVVHAQSSSKADDHERHLDSSFIDAYDAVQTLEERNQQAARAMQLLDEALRAAENAGCEKHAFGGPPVPGSTWHADILRPSQDLRKPVSQLSPTPHRAPQAPWSMNGAGQRHKGLSNSPVVTQFPGQEQAYGVLSKKPSCKTPGSAPSSAIGDVPMRVAEPSTFANEQDREGLTH